MQINTCHPTATGEPTIFLSSSSAIEVAETSTDFSCRLRKGTISTGTPLEELRWRFRCCRPEQPIEGKKKFISWQCASVRCVSLGQSWVRLLRPTGLAQLQGTQSCLRTTAAKGCCQGRGVMLSFAFVRPELGQAVTNTSQATNVHQCIRQLHCRCGRWAQQLPMTAPLFPHEKMIC